MPEGAAMSSDDQTGWARAEAEVNEFREKMQHAPAELHEHLVRTEIVTQLMWINGNLEELVKAIHRVADNQGLGSTPMPPMS
jgi:hypothetical protein